MSKAQFSVSRISPGQASKVALIEEGQFSDVKAIEIKPANLTKTMSAFANTDGGDLYIGVDEAGATKSRKWRGFVDVEAANGHVQCFEKLFPLGTDIHAEFLRCDFFPGLVLHYQINKTPDIRVASNDLPYIRRGAQNIPVDDETLKRRLEFAKGIASFETSTVNAPVSAISASETVKSFISQVIPDTTPEKWLLKQMLIRDGMPTVAGLLLFGDEPQAALPKRCGIKVYRYKTKDAEGFRDVLASEPLTVEGCLQRQIRSAVATTIEVVQGIPKLGTKRLEYLSYPQEALHEIITNAVLHRDYSIADDVHIRIFDNRIEVQSPGRLPAHITIENILEERFERNGATVRILNKFPDPPNKDIGEGLNTAFRAMTQLGLKPPAIHERDNCVLVTIKHEVLASPEEAILDYLGSHDAISNATAREITHISAQHKIKVIFKKMLQKGFLEVVPGTKTSQTAYRKPRRTQKANEPALPLIELFENHPESETIDLAVQPEKPDRPTPIKPLKGQRSLFGDEQTD